MIKRYRSRPMRRMRPRRYKRKLTGKRYVRSIKSNALTRPKYMFCRWINAAASGDVSTSGCVYNTSTSVLSCQLVAGIAEMDFGMVFRLSQVANYSEFQNLFDQYKLNCSVVEIKMLNVPEAVDAPGVPSASSNNYGNFYPTVWYSPDHDDASAITLSQIKEFANVKHKVLRPNREVRIVIKPTTLQQVYYTAVNSAYAVNFKRPWLDMAQPDIPHYGLKMCIDLEGLTNQTTVAGDQFQFKINVKHYFSCKNVR